jgi:RNA polymerase sigma factor (sigma-70 family)
MAATKQATRLLKHIRELATAGGTAVTAVPPVPFSDKELLDRFARERDEVAFTAVLHRHGPMVLRVCRRVLRNSHDAEDAFQATFLLLARKASAKGWHDSVANWLYQTAYHLALKARAAATRRSAHEARAGSKTRRDPLDDLTGRELQAVLDEELTRLPEKYRVPLVLCYLEGTTRDEAAQQLGWPLSTLGLRLEQGRDRLRGRLERRGLMFSAALSAALITERASAATLSSAFLASTVRAASLVAAGKTATGAVSASVVCLLQEGLKTFVATKLTIAAVLLVALTALTIGGGMWARQPVAAELPLPESATKGQESGVRGRKSEVRSQAPALSKSRSLTSDFRPLGPGLWDKGKVPITGRVLDDHGKPIKDAQVAVIMRPRRRLHAWEWANFAFDMADTVGNDSQGRFQVDAPAPTDRVLEPVTPPWPRDETALVVGAPGHGVAWQSLEGQSEPSQAVISLPAEQVLHGRLIDLQGQPAAGVQIVVARVRNKSPSKGGEGIDFRVPPEGLPAWPKPVITDAEGRFTVRGIGPNHAVTLEVRDDRFARQQLKMETGGKASPEESRFALTPARRIVGRVVYADTRAAVPNVRLSVWVVQRSRRAFLGAVEGRANAQGRFAINTFAGDSLGITAYAPEGGPYLNPVKHLEWPKGAVQQEIEIALPRGILVRGTVTEKASGKPVPGATVEFWPYQFDNREIQSGVTVWTTTGPNGRFRIAVPSGHGHLLINGPSPDYIPQIVGGNELHHGRPGGQPSYFHARLPLNLKAEDDTKDVEITLRRGVTVKGYLVGPDDKPVRHAQMLCGGRPAPLERNLRPLPIRDGTFELHGCDPDAVYPALFLTAPYQPGINWISVRSNKPALMMKLHLAPFFGKAGWLGAAVQISAKQAGSEPMRVRLMPCASVALRLVNGAEQLQPLVKFHPDLDLVVKPGPDLNEAWDRSVLAGEIVALVDSWVRWNPVGIVTDMQGRLTLTGLIPGATYRINNLDGTVAKEFQAPTRQPEKAPEITVKLH